jgi:DNA-binding SARP family transcriptional activator/predicted negative regulator of RcsB-dependent stress response
VATDPDPARQEAQPDRPLALRLGARIVPPAITRGSMVRSALERRLQDALQRRLTVVVGDAGFGKSTLLASWSTHQPVAWYGLDPDDRVTRTIEQGVIEAIAHRLPTLRAELAGPNDSGPHPDDPAAELVRAGTMAGRIADILDARLDDDLVLVLDDLHEIDDSPGAARFVEALVRNAPERLHVVLLSRTAMPFPIVRLRGQGQVVEIGGVDLAFSVAEVRTLLGDVDDEAVTLAEQVHAVTQGWPSAVRLVVEAFRGVAPGGRSGTLRRVQRPGGALFSYVAEEVLARESPATLEFLRVAARFERVSLPLLAALGLPDMHPVVADLRRRALFLDLQSGGQDWLTLHALIRDYAVSRLPLDDEAAANLHARAGGWFEAAALPEDALRSYAAAGRTDDVARLLGERGSVMLASGAVERIVRAERALSDDLRGPGTDLLLGDALVVQGDWDAAMASYMPAGGTSDRLDAALAWRIGLIHHLRGEIPQALAVYQRGTLEGAPPREAALLLSWRATAHFLLGDMAEGSDDAVRSVAAAIASNDDRALAAAHAALGVRHFLQPDPHGADHENAIALAAAERAGDAFLIVRIRINGGFGYLDLGRFADAQAEFDEALKLAELVGLPSFQAIALTGRGSAATGLARFEEALSDFRAARALFERIGSRWIAHTHFREGNLHLLRGDLTLARRGFEDAIRIAEQSGDRQVLLPALAALAEALAPDEPESARVVVERALALDYEIGKTDAVLAAGRVALAAGDLTAAIAWAREGASVARSHGDGPGLAVALEIEGMATTDRDLAVDRLADALAIWRQAGSPFGEARNRLALAHIIRGADGLAIARDVERRFREYGARRYAERAAGLIASIEEAKRPAVAIQALGAFRIMREDAAVGSTEWQSKKARDLLKILVARRGKPTPRDTLIELLWPEEEPGSLGNRLSVALSTVRATLDPNKHYLSDRFVVAEKASIALNLSTITIDVEVFLENYEAARRLARAGRADEARSRLLEAEEAYAGDFLEEDVYEDWAIPLREEAKAAYVTIARSLADEASRAGQRDQAARFLLRVLERDAYDEQAHLGLVAALVESGRHGEARRRYGLYAAKMDEIGIEAAAFPVVARARSSTRDPAASSPE